MGLKILGGVVCCATLILVLELVRRNKLTFKYAVGWLFMSLVGLFFAVFDQYLFRLAAWFGFTLPSNFIFFTLLYFFIFLSLCLTIFLCQQNERNDIMAQKIGLLELEISEIKKQTKQDSTSLKS